MLKKLSEGILNFKKKYENSALILNGLIMIACGAILIDKLNYLISEDEKLPAEIWGTVSDWFVVIITLVTAVFLYKTLYAQNMTLDSQLDVQKEQNRLFKIEELKYLREIKPNVNLNIFKVNKFNNNNHLTHLELSINLTTVKAKNMYHKVHTQHPHPQLIEAYGDLTGEKFYLPNVSEIKLSPTFPSLFVEMTYEDCDGNLYLFKKEIIYLVDENNNTYSYNFSEFEELVKPVY